MENKETFEYNYAAMEQNEVKKIRKNTFQKKKTKWSNLEN